MRERSLVGGVCEESVRSFSAGFRRRISRDEEDLFFQFPEASRFVLSP